jgi:predicted NUDIX family phosphoesterase
VSPARRTGRAAERVLVIPRRVIMADPGWHGLRSPGRLGAPRRRAFERLVARHGRFLPRPAMEVDRRYKQVIPYLVLRDGERIFVMRRSRAGADARLHDRVSIGVGGHLNPGDRHLSGGLRREWHEELAADFTPRFRFLGLLNDDTTDVGAVHLGAVFVADVRARPVRVRETDKLDGWFSAPDELGPLVARMETWSVLVLAALRS